MRPSRLAAYWVAGWSGVVWTVTRLDAVQAPSVMMSGTSAAAFWGTKAFTGRAAHRPAEDGLSPRLVPRLQGSFEGGTVFNKARACYDRYFGKGRSLMPRALVACRGPFLAVLLAAAFALSAV